MRLTFPQQDIYFEQLMYPDDPIYNIGAKIAIKGDIIYKVLNEAYTILIDQHDAYRSIVKESGEQVEIDMIKKHDSCLELVDFSTYVDADAKANVFMQETFQIPFVLNSHKLLHKFILVKVSENYHYLFSVYHHIITDGWGTSLMFQRLVANYNELIGVGKVTTEYPFTYQDFVEDDQAYALSDDYENDKSYWRERFQPLPERLFERTGDMIKPNQSKRKELIVGRFVYNQLEDLGKALGSSTFHVILGILYLYFGRKHQNKDFAIGLPVLNRGKSMFKKTVGLFMGITPLRMQFTFDDSFEDLIKKIKQQLRQDYRHQRFPLGKLVHELRLFREKDRLFNITLSYENQNYADHFVSTETRVIPLSHQSERVALAIYIREFDRNADVKIDFDYNVNYFTESSINQVIAHFEVLLAAVIADSKEKLCKYQYLTSREKEQLIENFNKTQFNYPKKSTIVDLFKAQASRTPENVAVADELKVYSYRDLDILSDKIAIYLQKKSNKGQPGPVAVLMDRSADLIIALLGILKSGSAYIPLDTSFPKDRLEYIVQHSEVRQIMGVKGLTCNMRLSQEFIDVETIITRRHSLSSIEIRKPSASDAAYIIYTSGSTGNPKGVVISHRALVNFLTSMQGEPTIEAYDQVFSVTTQSFDISILEFFAPLISGASVYIASNRLLSDPLAIVAKVEELNPTIIQATPSFYQMLYNAGWNGNKTTKILCGGDLLSETLAEKLIETNAEVWNMYGPTETTIWSSCKKITQANEARIIGKPIRNTEFYVLDENLQLLPLGCTGNIYIGGDGLAEGYFKNEELTKEKFIQSPFDESNRVYNTGDLGRWNENGEIEFLGRSDHQVKIRGYRIELGEIETALNQINDIKSAVVVAQRNAAQESKLIAYVIAATHGFNSAVVIQALREKLPEYMIPHIIVPLEEFPLTPNKKVDRKALALCHVYDKAITSTYEEPISEMELNLCRYYSEALGLKDRIGTRDDFFVLGGHSLKAVKLINLINEHLRHRITLKDIFDYPTVQTLSKHLEKRKTHEKSFITRTTESPHYQLTYSQYNIWVASQQKEKSVAYNMAAAFKIFGQINKTVLREVFLQIVKKHEIFRTNFIQIAGIPQQKVAPAEKIQISIDEFFSTEGVILESIHSYANKEFDFENDTLLRISLFHLENGCSYLVFCTHHIIMDGWSLEILINEVVNKYRAIDQNEVLNDAELKFQFKDYVAWYQSELKRTNETRLAFWTRYLDGYTWKTIIPFDRELYEDTQAGAVHDYVYQSIHLSALNTLIQEQKISLHTLLFTVFNLLMHKMHGHSDICIGTANAGRTLAALHDQLGMYVKTIPLRTIIKPDHTFLEMLKEAHQNLLRTDEFQDVPESIQNSLRLDVLMVLQNPSFDYTNIHIHENLHLQMHPVKADYSKLPLTITFSVNEETIASTIHYDAVLYERETIELIQLKFEKLLGEVLKDPNALLHSIDIELSLEKERTIDISFDF